MISVGGCFVYLFFFLVERILVKTFVHILVLTDAFVFPISKPNTRRHKKSRTNPQTTLHTQLLNETTAVRLFNQGLDIVEVSDDGTGVPEASRPYLAQAHATSKIRSFEDIYTSSSTLGFRGEALFCLANLSEKLVVATRTDDDRIGQKIEYRHDGSMDPQSTEMVPRKRGTTVAVVKLLNSLPVRRADLERRIVQHRSKLIKLMESCTYIMLLLLDSHIRPSVCATNVFLAAL